MHAIVYYHGSMQSACMCMWPAFTWNSVFANNGHAIMHVHGYPFTGQVVVNCTTKS